jgi:hypothetical protein
MEQFGSQNKHTLSLQACNTKFTLDTSRQKRVTIALYSTDIKCCYEIVVHSVSSLAMQQQNVPE